MDHSTSKQSGDEVGIPGSPLALKSMDQDRQPNSTPGEEVNSALGEEEVARARAWALCMLALPTIASAFTPWMPGATIIKWGFALSALSYSAAAAWVYWRIRDSSRYTPAVFRCWGYFSVGMTVPLQYCLGTFSPTPLIVTLGLSFFGFGRDRHHAVIICSTAIAAYFCLSLLILTGVIPDLGILSSTGFPTIVLGFFSVMVPLVLISGLFFSRASHSALVKAVTQATAAQRLAGQREGQLFEAERDLEAVLHVGAGMEGRYTGFQAGRYTLTAVIGRGAMGEVYAATDPHSANRAAVKVIHYAVLGDPLYRQRFLREGAIGTDLKVPNVVRVFEVGQLTPEVPYIAMELLVGEDLRTMLRRDRKLRLSQCVDLCAQAGAGIDAAHRAGIVHRDVKPQNLFFHRDPSQLNSLWKVLDFGVSALTDTSGTLTQGAIVGTPAYMAPEQARAEEVDHRCDVYSLGAVLYRSLTGTAPFWGATPAKILYEVEYRMPTRPSQLAPSLPLELDAVLAIALAKSRDDRFDSALELSEAFSQAARKRLSQHWEDQAARNLSRHPWGTQIHPSMTEKKASLPRANPTHATVPFGPTRIPVVEDQD